MRERNRDEFLRRLTDCLSSRGLLPRFYGEPSQPRVGSGERKYDALMQARQDAKAEVAATLRDLMEQTGDRRFNFLDHPALADILTAYAGAYASGMDWLANQISDLVTNYKNGMDFGR